jgi:hypothetical protein
MFQIKYEEEIKTHVSRSVTLFFSQKNLSLRDNVEKYSRAGQAIDKGMAHVHCVLDT